MENKCLKFYVSDELAGLRLDKGISEQYEDISRSRIAGIIKEGGVSVGDKVMKASYILKAGDNVEFSLPASEIPDILPEDIPIEILMD